MCYNAVAGVVVFKQHFSRVSQCCGCGGGVVTSGSLLGLQEIAGHSCSQVRAVITVRNRGRVPERSKNRFLRRCVNVRALMAL
jgi:hypothetical protein